MKVLHSKGVKIVILSSVDFATSTKEESICLASQRLEDGTFETARIAFPTLPVHFVGTGEKSIVCFVLFESTPSQRKEVGIPLEILPHVQEQNKRSYFPRPGQS